MKITAKKDTSLSANSPVRRELSENLVKELGKVLNEVHGKNLSLRFWKIVLASYLNTAISSKELFEESEITAAPNLVAINSFKPLSFKQKARADLVRYVKFAKTVSESKKILKILSENNNFTLAFPDIDIIKKELGMNLPTRYPLFFGKGKTKLRTKLNKIAEGCDDLYYRNLLRQIPTMYVEHFDTIYNSIPLINPKEKVFHIHTLQSDFMEFLVAKYIDSGAKLYWYQHGGCYGEYLYHNAHFNESALADEFRTYGWKINENDVPWKAYRLEEFKEKYLSETKEKEYDVMLCYTNVYEGNIEWMISITDILLNKSNPDKYKTFLARPRPLSKLKSHKDELSFINDKRVEIDSGLSTMAKLIKESKVVVQFEVPCTNYLECIYVNHPTVGLLLNKEPTEVIKPYYDFFLQEGVLHYDFDSLVTHLNKVDVDKWWKELVEKPMYKTFKETFAKEVNLKNY